MTGAGPSRRSHTKSRTGCKTCKKRHIRCDETFPQCRNCTKHQVRCDYMDAIGSDHVPSASPESEPIVLSSTPYVEASIDQWTRNGTFPFANLQEIASPALYDLSRNDLRLLHHICTVANDLQSSGTDQLTVWARKMPRFLSLASSFPFVMHAILSFSANHLSWAQSSSAIRSLQVQHGGIALRGLHDAIGAFSRTNADAILAASMLMCWQSTDWLSYSSLTAGMQSVMQAMQSWRHESILLEMFSDFPGIRTVETPNRGPVSMNERVNILNNIIDALQRLQISLVGHDLELHWVGQLLAYVYRIQNSAPAQTPEEHLEHTYLLRKWVFWVPVSLLQRGTNRGPSLLVLAHLYATAIAFCELFPGVNHRYSSVMALQPLETIISMTEAMQFEHSNSSTLEIRNLMHFARQTAWSYRESHIESQASPASSFQSYQQEIFHSANNMSPAFTPAPPDPAITAEFLAAPMHLGEGFTHGVSNWGAMPSPGFPPLQGDISSIDTSDDFRGLHGGFVNPLPIWT